MEKIDTFRLESGQLVMSLDEHAQHVNLTFWWERVPPSLILLGIGMYFFLGLCALVVCAFMDAKYGEDEHADTKGNSWAFTIVTAWPFVIVVALGIAIPAALGHLYRTLRKLITRDLKNMQ